jgi:hypothetical protein
MHAVIAHFASAELASQIERIVRSRAGSQIEQLRVEMEGDTVILSGIARTYYAKQLATQAVMLEVPECEICNSIEVR